MRNTLAMAILLAALPAACRTPPEAAGGKRYRAWCTTDSRHLGPWRETREAAEADREEHRKSWGWHAIRIETAG
jgi:hypothetical protein